MPLHRRSGAGRALLDTAADEALGRPFKPVLDVLAMACDATRLYERRGWSRVGQFECSMPDCSDEPAFAYALPPVPPRSRARSGQVTV